MKAKLSIVVFTFNLNLIFLFSLFLPIQVRGQKLPVYHFPYQHLTIIDGLSQPQAKCIHIDSKGFIWIGTNRGINRFDGFLFENLLTNEKLPDDQINDIDEQDNGRLWFSGQKGLYELRVDTVINHLPSKYPEIEPSYIAAGRKKVWFTNKSNREDLFMLDEKGELSNLPLKYPQLRENVIYKIKFFENPVPHLIIITRNKIKGESYAVWRLKDNQLSLIEDKIIFDESMNFLSNPSGSPHVSMANSIFSIEEEGLQVVKRLPLNFLFFAFREQDTIIVNKKRDRLYKFTKEGKQDYGIDLTHVNDLAIDGSGRVWIATEDGVIKVKSEAFVNYPQERGMLKYVWNVLEDERGVIWFASYGNGLGFLKDHKYYFPQEYKKYYDIDNFYMGGLRANNRDLLFPHSKGVLKFNYENGFSLIPGAEGNPVLFLSYDESTRRFYAGTRGLKEIGSNGQLLNFYTTENGLDIDFFKLITSIQKDRNGILWLGSHNGLAKFDGTNFVNYRKNEAFGAISIHRDYKDNLWFGSSDGIYLYNYSTELPNPALKDIVKGTVTFVTSVDSSFLFIGSERGLSVIKLDDFYNNVLAYKMFDYTNTFEGWGCIQNSALVDSKKHTWVATANQVIKVLPEKLDFSPELPRVYLSKLEIYRDAETKKVVDLGGVNNADVNISSRENNIGIEYGAIEYSSPDQVSFRYKLEGRDRYWSEISKRRFVGFPDLLAKEYCFKVKACIKDTLCSNPAELLIKVEPANFFEISFIKKARQSWAIILGILVFCLGSLLYIIHIYRIKNLNLYLRSKLALNQINPHFIFNFITAIGNSIKENEEAYNNLVDFSEIIRPVLEDGDVIMRTLEDEIEIVERYLKLEQIRFADKFRVTFEVHKDLTNLNCYIPKMIIQTFVNNAVRHAFTGLEVMGELEVLIFQKNDFIHIHIKDNGIGREASLLKPKVHSSGNGIKIVSRTLSILNKKYAAKSSFEIIDLKDNKGFPTGTKVELKLYSKYEIDSL